MNSRRLIQFNYLVGAAEQWQRHCDAERPGGLEIQEQLNFRGLLDRAGQSPFAQ